MIYLSLLELSPRSRQVQAELRKPYEMHRTLSKAFVNDPDGKAAEIETGDNWESARCLFRVDEIASSPEPRLLVQSRVRPEWERLTVKADYLAAPPCVKAWSPTFRTGQVLAFRLRANPTIKEDSRKNGKKNGRRIPLLTETDRLAWLARKAQIGGFGLSRVVARQEDPLECRTAGGCATTLNAVRFDGMLVVRDPAAFMQALEAGIGSGKAFGFGLLSVARVAR